MLQPLTHYGIHFFVPLVVALLLNRKQWFKTYCILVVTMLIDLDHLLATPIFDPNRCSINFHFLHSYPAIVAYIALLIPEKTRLVAIGLCIHIIADTADCGFML